MRYRNTLFALLVMLVVAAAVAVGACGGGETGARDEGASPLPQATGEPLIFGFNGGFNQQCVGICCFFKHVGWDFTHHQFVVSVVVVGIGLHVNKVNYAVNVLFKPNWQVDWQCVFA